VGLVEAIFYKLFLAAGGSTAGTATFLPVCLGNRKETQEFT